jgi:YspA, cpYpsA-related SLOG family
MRLVIFGPRDLWPSIAAIGAAVEAMRIDMDECPVTEVVSGCADGVDTMALEWARANRIEAKEFPADWDRYGNSAGPRRNAQMADYSDAGLCFGDGSTKGTRNMLEQMRKRGKRVVMAGGAK